MVKKINTRIYTLITIPSLHFNPLLARKLKDINIYTIYLGEQALPHLFYKTTSVS
ncbi:hypothetical protein [Saccharolobus islandicus]|uniref:Uncharacterized protein n=1 Tax=Saccharolobus islandicus (strain REY15A) TaxID=930945 RepID=F0NCH7_SACI5|nr:hypothetical protein [Sulfolobus islandicus]ADX86124.1 hypothetical protein SiRe_2066 [Sulfolobus islandicus REY15A]